MLLKNNKIEYKASIANTKILPFPLYTPSNMLYTIGSGAPNRLLNLYEIIVKSLVSIENIYPKIIVL
jgi:hypothetical protein